MKAAAQVATTGEALTSVYTRAVGSSNLSAPTGIDQRGRVRRRVPVGVVPTTHPYAWLPLTG